MLTFHKTLAGCEEGSRAAWQGFITNYSPIIFRILSVYAPACDEQCQREVWRESLRALSADNFQRLRMFDHRSEREFMVGLRAFVLEAGSNRLEPSTDARVRPKPTPDTVKSLLKGLPLIHQLVMFLKLAGYSDPTLEKILRVTPTLAREGLERLRGDYSIVLKPERDAGVWPAAWMDLLRHAWAGKTEACAPLRQFVRILDGQTDWGEKESVEKHVEECLHCLERWTALREVLYGLQHLTPLPPDEADGFISCLSVKADGKKSFLKRLFGYVEAGLSS